jgi:hypothetical protein
MELVVIGVPLVDASPEPRAAMATPSPEPEASEDGAGAGAIAGVGLAGLLVGLVGGGFAARRR